MNCTKIEHWSRVHVRLATLTFYTAYAVRVTKILVLWEIPPCFDFYIVTHSYSSRRSYALLPIPSTGQRAKNNPVLKYTLMCLCLQLLMVKYNHFTADILIRRGDNISAVVH